MAVDKEKLGKVSIIISRGTVEGIYPGLIMANGARMEGIEANIFFTFFGLHAIHKKKMKKIRVDTVGNPALGIPPIIGIIPGMSAMVTRMMLKEMDKLDIPPVDEFLEMIAAAGANIYACKAAMDMFHFTKEDLIDEVADVLTVGQFYEIAAGGAIIFT
ncbi:MAG: hypothetical protein GXO78_08535 [Calditrichaeota bacterium]|nr:hypothetical protein [Calditrichota bacterium]